MMVTISNSESFLQPLLADSTTKLNKAQFYITLTEQLRDEEITGQIYEEIRHQSAELTTKVCQDVEGSNNDISMAAIQMFGVCLHTEKLASALTDADCAQALQMIQRVIRQTTEKTICTRALWCLASKGLRVSVLRNEVESIIKVILCAMATKNFRSMTVEHEGLNAIIRLLEEAPEEMAPLTGQWGKLVYPLILHGAAKIRDRAVVAMDLGLELILRKPDDVAKSLMSDLKTKDKRPSLLLEQLTSLMSTKQEVFAMRVWEYYVKILGQLLHHGQLINQLLPYVEQAFKNSAPAVKCAAYRAWSALIANFALNLDILADGKRVKLIMQVFKLSNAKVESVAMEKLKSWWFFLQKLGSQAPSYLDTVAVPLLNFCVGGITAKTIIPGSAQRTPTMARLGMMASPATPNTPGSPMPQFRQLQLIGAQVLGRILGSPLEDPSLPAAKFTIEPLDEDIIAGPAMFVKFFGVLISAVKECICSLQGDLEDGLLYHIWYSLVAHVKNVLEFTNKKDAAEVLAFFLTTLHHLVETQSLPPEKLLKLVQAVLCLPSKALASSSYAIGTSQTGMMQGTPVLFLLDLLFNHRMLETSANHERFFLLLEKLIVCGMSNSTGALGFMKAILQHVDQAAPKIEERESIWRMWSLMVNPLLEHILKTNEVNAGDALEHDFSCMYAALQLPLLHLLSNDFSTQALKSMMRTWDEMYTTFSRLAALVTNAEANVCCEELSSRIVTMLDNNPEKLTDMACVDSLTQICQIIVGQLDFSGLKSTSGLLSPGKFMTKKKPRPLGNLHSLIKLVAIVTDALHQAGDTTSQDKTPSGPTLQIAAIAVIDVLTMLFNHMPSSGVVAVAIEKLASATSSFYTGAAKRPSNKMYSQQVLTKLEKLWLDIVTCIQARYQGQYDSDFLTHMSRLLEATFLHPRRPIKNQTAILWNATFAHGGPLTYPAPLKTVLAKVKEKTPISLPGWDSTEIMQVEETEMSQMSQGAESQVPLPNIAGLQSPHKAVGSFMNKVASPEVKKSPLKRGKSPSVTPGARKKLGLDDMNSNDFVVITPTTRRTRVLTHHQREVARERKAIPAMYNNLDASQDRSLTSQHSVTLDSSSMDASQTPFSFSAANKNTEATEPQDAQEPQHATPDPEPAEDKQPAKVEKKKEKKPVSRRRSVTFAPSPLKTRKSVGDKAFAQFTPDPVEEEKLKGPKVLFGHVVVDTQEPEVEDSVKLDSDVIVIPETECSEPSMTTDEPSQKNILASQAETSTPAPEDSEPTVKKGSGRSRKSRSSAGSLSAGSDAESQAEASESATQDSEPILKKGSGRSRKSRSSSAGSLSAGDEPSQKNILESQAEISTPATEDSEPTVKEGSGRSRKSRSSGGSLSAGSDAESQAEASEPATQDSEPILKKGSKKSLSSSAGSLSAGVKPSQKNILASQAEASKPATQDSEPIVKKGSKKSRSSSADSLSASSDAESSIRDGSAEGERRRSPRKQSKPKAEGMKTLDTWFSASPKKQPSSTATVLVEETQQDSPKAMDVSPGATAQDPSGTVVLETPPKEVAVEETQDLIKATKQLFEKTPVSIVPDSEIIDDSQPPVASSQGFVPDTQSDGRLGLKPVVQLSRLSVEDIKRLSPKKNTEGSSVEPSSDDGVSKVSERSEATTVVRKIRRRSSFKYSKASQEKPGPISPINMDDIIPSSQDAFGLATQPSAMATEPPGTGEIEENDSVVIVSQTEREEVDKVGEAMDVDLDETVDPQSTLAKPGANITAVIVDMKNSSSDGSNAIQNPDIIPADLSSAEASEDSQATIVSRRKRGGRKKVKESNVENTEESVPDAFDSLLSASMLDNSIDSSQGSTPGRGRSNRRRSMPSKLKDTEVNTTPEKGSRKKAEKGEGQINLRPAETLANCPHEESLDINSNLSESQVPEANEEQPEKTPEKEPVTTENTESELDSQKDEEAGELPKVTKSEKKTKGKKRKSSSRKQVKACDEEDKSTQKKYCNLDIDSEADDDVPISVLVKKQVKRHAAAAAEVVSEEEADDVPLMFYKRASEEESQTQGSQASQDSCKQPPGSHSQDEDLMSVEDIFDNTTCTSTPSKAVGKNKKLKKSLINLSINMKTSPIHKKLRSTGAAKLNRSLNTLQKRRKSSPGSPFVKSKRSKSVSPAKRVTKEKVIDDSQEQIDLMKGTELSSSEGSQPVTIATASPAEEQEQRQSPRKLSPVKKLSTSPRRSPRKGRVEESPQKYTLSPTRRSLNQSLEMPETPTSATKHQSRASLILERSRLFAPRTTLHAKKKFTTLKPAAPDSVLEDLISPAKSILKPTLLEIVDGEEAAATEAAALVDTKESASPPSTRTVPSASSPSFRPVQIPRIYSPSASPSAGILKKRKLSGEIVGTDSPSPPNKQRRVSFNEAVDVCTLAGKDAGRPVNRCLDMPAKSAFTTSPLVTLTSKVTSNQSKFLTSSKVESSEAEKSSSGFAIPHPVNKKKEPEASQNSVRSVAESQLNSEEPIFPELQSCTDPIDQILPQLTSSTWVRGLGQLIRSKNIRTIGDLCALTEYDVNNLPIRTPKVTTVRQVLEAHAALIELRKPKAVPEGSKDPATSDDESECNCDMSKTPESSPSKAPLPSVEEALAMSPIREVDTSIESMTEIHLDLRTDDTPLSTDHTTATMTMQVNGDHVTPMEEVSPHDSAPTEHEYHFRDPMGTLGSADSLTPMVPQEPTQANSVPQTQVNKASESNTEKKVFTRQLLKEMETMATKLTPEVLAEMPPSHLVGMHRYLNTMMTNVIQAQSDRCPLSPR